MWQLRILRIGSTRKATTGCRKVDRGGGIRRTIRKIHHHGPAESAPVIKSTAYGPQERCGLRSRPLVSSRPLFLQFAAIPVALSRSPPQFIDTRSVCGRVVRLKQEARGLTKAFSFKGLIDEPRISVRRTDVWLPSGRAFLYVNMGWSGQRYKYPNYYAVIRDAVQ